MQAHSASPASMMRAVWLHRALVLRLAKHDVQSRYKGSLLGLLWSFFNPLFMLGVYTLVFAGIFSARWPGGGDSALVFAMMLFVGLTVFTLVSDCVTRAPTLIVGHSHFVKKMRFPLEVLPISLLGGALFHAAVSVSVWLLAHLLLFGLPPLSALLLPVMLFPVVLLTAGLSWMLAALGVFLRDIYQVVTILTTALLFLSAVFFPVTALPEAVQPVILIINPVAAAIEQSRAVLFWGEGVDWQLYGYQMISGVLMAWVGYAVFQKTRRGFSDVL